MNDEIDKKRIKKLRKKIELHSTSLDRIINKIVNPYCEELDEYVTKIKDCLDDTDYPPTAQQLEDFCMNLSTLIYFASSMCESLGVRDDVGKAVYKEMYHTARTNAPDGTVHDKNSLAELASQEEYIVSVCYTRAYKILKAKVESAQELLSSAKKVLSHRMAEEELTRMTK